nr:hypothetical protein [Sporomusa silvacetica]
MKRNTQLIFLVAFYLDRGKFNIIHLFRDLFIPNRKFATQGVDLHDEYKAVRGDP